MYWILATIFIVVALAVPKLRVVGVVGLVLLGAMLTWAVLQRLRDTPDGRQPQVQERGRPTSPALLAQTISPELVRLDAMKMTGGGAPFELRGYVENRSDALLKSFTLLVTRRDCYESAMDPSGCVVLWQDRLWISLSVAPGEAREFTSSVWVRGAAPRVRGTVEDSFEVVAASGAPR